MEKPGVYAKKAERNFHTHWASFLAACGLLATASLLHSQWVETGGPYGQTITSLAILHSPGSPGDTTYLLAGTLGGGVYRIPVAGGIWRQDTIGLRRTDVISLAVKHPSAPGDTSSIFAGTNGGGIFRSLNGGATWAKANGGLTDSVVYAMTVSNGAVFAGTFGSGVFRSDDDGTTWKQANTGLANHYVKALAASNAGIFAGTYLGGVFRSVDGGNTWTEANQGLDYSDVTCLVALDSALFAGTYGGGVFRSADAGDSWAACDQQINLWVPALAVQRAPSGIYVFAGTSGGGVFFSADGGRSWKQINAGLTNTWISALLTCPDPEGTREVYVFAGTDGSGVWRRSLSEILTSVESRLSGLPVGFALEQNTPNPFTGATRITFAVPFHVYTCLTVYDTLGREIATLLAQDHSPGTHSLIWDASGLPSGVYLFRLQAGPFCASRKAVLFPK
ncbi:MAG: hypothetical protein ONB30_06110 [candidate division KSB1 bacterium]|nr:hypothetical protein [candidate division KSB1 bacterium]